MVTELTEEIGIGLSKPKEEALNVREIARACKTILDTDPSVLVS